MNQISDRCSIIIPTYNRATLLDKTLNSIQKLKDITLVGQVIICDSNSTDKTVEVIEHYAEKIRSIEFLHINTDNNISKKRNHGIHKANNEFLIFFDDDCELYPDCIELHLKFLKEHPNNIVSGGVFFPEDQVSESNYIRYRDSRHRYADGLQEEENQLDYKQIVTMNMGARKSELFKTDLFFDENFLSYGMEDNDFGYRAQKMGFSLGLSKGSIIHHDHHTFITFKKKIYSTARDGTSTFLKKFPEAVYDFYYSRYLEKNYPHSTFSGRLFSRICRLLLLNSLASLMTKFVVMTDHLEFFYNKTIFRYILATEYLRGVKHRGRRFISQEEIKGSFFDQ